MLIRHPNSARGNDLYETPQAAMQTAFSAVEDEVARVIQSRSRSRL